LLGAVSGLDARGGSNTILFDIQEDQVEGVEQTLTDLDLSIDELTPIVTMRLLEVGDRSVSEIRDDTSFSGQRWAFLREYRSTFRDSLTDSETIVEGVWHGDSKIDTDAETVVSLEQDIADDLGVGVGDTLVLDVQGIPITAEIGSIRSVDWRRMSSNFFMVFDDGIIGEAPKFFVMATRVTDDQQGATLQRDIVRQFPNVSIIDLELILKTAGSILDRISFVIRFMALFCIFTGILVLIASVSASRYQRLRESMLLRTLGASAKQIVAILNIENIFLGSMAALTGSILAVLVSWLITKYMFEITYVPSWLAIPVAFVVVAGFTVLFGSMGSRGAVKKPPLAVLRAESGG
jgi:putative ABC transport system permease protein